MFAVATDPRTIKKMVLDTEDIEKNLRGEVITKAFKNFGYKAEAFGVIGPLAKILKSLGIIPFETEAVNQYKKSKERSFRFNTACLGYIAMNLFTLVLCMTIATKCYQWSVNAVPQANATDHDSVLVIQHEATVDGKTIHSYTPNGAFAAIPTAAVALLLLIFGNIWVTQAETWFSTFSYKRFWQDYVLGKTEKWGQESYPRYIPTYALNYANQIKEACSEAQFFVSELTAKLDEIPKPKPDPFLCVKLDNEIYYIAVWDEKEFEEKA